MKYKNAAEILPERLLQELQTYSSGDILYIPKAGAKADWGTASGSWSFYLDRNQKIKALYSGGKTVDELAMQYGLSNSAIKKNFYH